MNNTQLITETVLSWKLNKLSAGRAMQIIDLATSRDPELPEPKVHRIDLGKFSKTYESVLDYWIKEGMKSTNPETLEPAQVPPEKDRVSPPRTLGEKAYGMRKRGLPWAKIGNKLNLGQLSALLGAKNYARKHGLEWPVKI